MPSIAQSVAQNQELELSGRKVYAQESVPPAQHSPNEFVNEIGAPIRATIDSIIMPSSPQWQRNSPLTGKGTTMRTGGIPLGALPTTQNNSAQQTAQLEAAAATAQNAANNIADATVLSQNSSGTVTSGPFHRAPHTKRNSQTVLPLDNISDGPFYGKVVQPALTQGQPDLSQPGVINKTLQWVADDPTTLGRYAAVAAHTSYRPTTNPLTSTDAGANATVSVASFNLRIRNSSINSDVSYNSGSVTALSYGTLYYVYVNDPLFAGGAVTYAATATKENTLSGKGYIFVGSILTAVSGGGATVGNNDGGATAQTGNMIGNYPTVIQSSGAWTNTANVLIGNGTSYTSPPFLSAIVIAGYSGLLLNGVPSTTLYVDIDGGGANVEIEDSLNSGSSYSTLYNATLASRSLLSFSIAPTNPGTVWIRVTTGSLAKLYRAYLIESY